MWTSQNGHSSVIKLLLEFGAQADIQDNKGETALMIASQNGHSKVVRLLQEYINKADPIQHDFCIVL